MLTHSQRPKVETVDEYMQLFPPATKERLQQIRALIKAVAPEANEVISYAIPAYKLPGKGRAFVFFSGYARHISLYPVLHTSDPELAQQIQPHIAGKGTLRFDLDKPLPLELVRRVVESLYAEAKSV